jgi:hypothetical protein
MIRYGTYSIIHSFLACCDACHVACELALRRAHFPLIAKVMRVKRAWVDLDGWCERDI